MEIDPTLRAVILVALLIGLTLVVYFELRHMRKKRKPKIDAELLRDEAYNSIVTAKAVASVLRERGRDTNNADQLIFQAENAYTRREYSNSAKLAKEAKRDLERTTTKNDEERERTFDRIIGEKEESEEEPETKTLYEEERELPENYLQSKFMIKNVEREIERGVVEGVSTTEAESLLGEAKRYFNSKDYASALRYACRADKCLALSGTQFIEVPGSSLGASEEVEEDQIIEDLVEESTSEIVDEAICSECGSILEEDDKFCGRCGTRVVKERRCPACGSPLREEDRFCRACGTPVT